MALESAPSMPAGNWLKVLENVDPKTCLMLRTHESELCFYLLGENI
jgi:hypothetical protein